jgi:6-phosphogluconate dehydrogenase
MHLGTIGLGRMGANMVRRLIGGGHECGVFDASPKAVAELRSEKAVGASSLAHLSRRRARPRAVWLMEPAAVVDKAIADLLPLLEQGATVVDGGNSFYVAPGRGDIPRTPGREKLGGTAELGYLHCGPNGAGHFVKMVHNGIEYGGAGACALLRALPALHVARRVGLPGQGVVGHALPVRRPSRKAGEVRDPRLAEGKGES